MKIKTKSLSFFVLDKNVYLYSILVYNVDTKNFWIRQYVKKNFFTSLLIYNKLNKKDFPDNDLLKQVKNLIKNENASISLLCRKLKISNYKANRYYWKVKRKLW